MRLSRYNIWRVRGAGHYVYNGVTGALLRLTGPERAALSRFVAGDRASGCPPETLLRLAQGGMLIEDDTDERDLLARRYGASRNRTDMLGLTIVTSLGCNFDCPYCYQKKHPNVLGPTVQTGLFALVDDRLRTARDLAVTWFGGEPLVGKKPLFALSEGFIERCARAGAHYSADIITNGYMLDARTAADLAALQVKRAQVTLDGPQDLHDPKRPLKGGGSTYHRILRNLAEAAGHLDITVRVNTDTANAPAFETLLQDLADAGLSGRIGVYAAQIVGISMNENAPSASYGTRCFSKPEFAQAEIELNRLACDYGFARATLPGPTGAPCTAVRDGELVVGSKGELYKCWYDVGNPGEVIGNIADFTNLNGRTRRWLSYDPFANPDCRACIALPVCMGGCAAHAMDPASYDDRCGTFRFSHAARIDAMIEATLAPPKLGEPA